MRSVACLLCVGCWTPASTAPLHQTPRHDDHRGAVTGRTIYADVTGEWRGVGTQYDDSSRWEMVLTLDPGAAIGAQIGTIEYPSLECGGVLTRMPELADGTLVLRETITHDARSQCIDGGTMQIPSRPDENGLAWRWFLPKDGVEHAAATLERR